MGDFQMQRSIEARDDATLAAIEDAAQAAEDRAGEIAFSVSEELRNVPTAEALADLIVDFDSKKRPLLQLADEVVFTVFRAITGRDVDICEATSAALKLYSELEEAMTEQRERDARRGGLS